MEIFDQTARANALRPDILSAFIGELMTDDERARMNRLPEGCRMRSQAKIYSPELLTCGKYVWIGENAKLDASGGLSIGDHTSIGLDVFVWSHTSFLTNLCMSNASGSSLIKRAATRIGTGCFIAGPSVVLAGCEIGDGCVVLPFSTITEDIPAFSLVAGAPAKRILAITPDWVAAKLDELPLEPIAKAQYLARFEVLFAKNHAAR